MKTTAMIFTLLLATAPAVHATSTDGRIMETTFGFENNMQRCCMLHGIFWEKPLHNSLTIGTGFLAGFGWAEERIIPRPFSNFISLPASMRLYWGENKHFSALGRLHLNIPIKITGERVEYARPDLSLLVGLGFNLNHGLRCSIAYARDFISKASWDPLLNFNINLGYNFARFFN